MTEQANCGGSLVVKFLLRCFGTLALSLWLTVAANASSIPVWIDFDTDMETSDFTEDTGYPRILRSQGFELYTEDGWLGSSYCPWCSATLTTVSGDAFSLLSVDLLSIWPGSGPDVITITGFLAGGGQVSTQVNLTGDYSNFSPGWTGLQSVEFGVSAIGNAITMDNLIVQAVPLPAAVWLFGPALAGLGFLRRRRFG